MIEYRRIVGAKRCWWCDAIVDDGGRFCPWTMQCLELWTEREAKYPPKGASDGQG